MFQGSPLSLKGSSAATLHTAAIHVADKRQTLDYSLEHYVQALASFPGLPRFFCSSVSVDPITRMRKGGEKHGRPGTIHHVSDVRWTGPVVVSADPEGCSSSSRLGSNAPRLVGTRRQCTQLLGRFLNLFAVGPYPAPTASRLDDEQPSGSAETTTGPAPPMSTLAST